MKTSVRLLVAGAGLAVLSLQPAAAYFIEAVVLDPFDHDLSAFNSLLGTDRSNDRVIHDYWVHADWNKDSIEILDDGSDSNTVTFQVNHYTTLSNRMRPGLGSDPDTWSSPYWDVVGVSGRSVFAPFDSSLGALEEVTVEVGWELDAVLMMSLCDDGFIANAEGHATGSTRVGSYFDIDDGYVFDHESRLDTGRQVSWSCFLGAMADWGNTMGGAPTLFDAALCMLFPDQCIYEPPDWSEQYQDTEGWKATSWVKLTPSEYAGLLDADGNFSVHTGIMHNHRFKFEGGDTFDSTSFISLTTGSLSVQYEYAAMAEPNALALFGLGLVALGILALGNRKS